MSEDKSWWQLLIINQKDMIDIVTNYHPWYRNNYSSAVITAPDAEMACEIVRNKIATETKDAPAPHLSMIQIMADDDRRDEIDYQTILTILNSAWFGLPESMESRGVEGFGVLCTLCEGA